MGLNGIFQKLKSSLVSHQPKVLVVETQIRLTLSPTPTLDGLRGQEFLRNPGRDVPHWRVYMGSMILHELQYRPILQLHAPTETRHLLHNRFQHKISN